ncbi:MAG: DUF4492 domain-containing protein [Bacteroidales bacterium]|nr:DUF4492 domain-containing protein [Bacteroidales bacterium]
MRKTGFWYRVFDLYYDGFRSMTLGRTLWVVILIKLFVIFVVLKIFFFPNFIKENAKEGDEAQFVSEQVLNRSDLP